MAWAFDTLGFSKRLRDAGVPQPQAEGHAEAARDFIMAELVTKSDLLGVKSDVLAVKNDVAALKSDLHAAMTALESRLDGNIEALSLKLDAKLENLSLRLTVRLGIMLVAAISLLAAIIRLS